MTPTPEQIGVARDRVAHGATFSKSEMQQLVDAADKLARLTALLEPLRPLEAKATPTEWRVQGRGGIRMDGMRDSHFVVSGPYEVCRSPMTGKEVEHRDDLALIAAARNALAEMLRVVGS